MRIKKHKNRRQWKRKANKKLRYGWNVPPVTAEMVEEKRQDFIKSIEDFKGYITGCDPYESTADGISASAVVVHKRNTLTDHK
jgi:hypothetical protein